MVITVEASFYPLKDDYEQLILHFIKELKSSESVEVYTHAMSTFIKGESSDVFKAIDLAMQSLGSQTASLVLKIINRNLPVQEGFINFNL